jgi:bacillithiol biosynthesis cysteine-adding enzyme BshC
MRGPAPASSVADAALLVDLTAPRWRDALEAARARPVVRETLVNRLRVQNAAWGAADAAMRAVDRLAGAETMVVVTGQQVGLFGGPLYTLLKALTAIKLARALEAAYGVPVVPCFWLQTDDHDLAEVARAALLDGEDALVTLDAREALGPEGASMGRVRVSAAFTDVTEALERALPAGEFAEEFMEEVRAAYAPPATLGDGFARLFARWLGRFGLVLLDPTDPDLRALGRSVFRRELADPLAATALVNAAGGEVHKSDDSTALFLQSDGLRRKLFFDGRDFQVELDGAADRACLRAAELARIVEETPERLSPNVILRPIVQDHLLPTIAYVAGPNELVYHEQLAGVYARYDLPQPLVVPRMGTALLDGRTQRALARTGLGLDDLGRGKDWAWGVVARGLAAAELDPLFDATAGDLRGLVAHLDGRLRSFDASLGPLVESTGRKLNHTLGVLRDKAAQAMRRREAELRRQVTHAAQWLFPEGLAQERVFSVAQVYPLAGPALFERLFDALELGAPGLQLVDLP